MVVVNAAVSAVVMDVIPLAFLAEIAAVDPVETAAWQIVAETYCFLVINVAGAVFYGIL